MPAQRNHRDIVDFSKNAMSLLPDGIFDIPFVDPVQLDQQGRNKAYAEQLCLMDDRFVLIEARKILKRRGRKEALDSLSVEIKNVDHAIFDLQNRLKGGMSIVTD